MKLKYKAQAPIAVTGPDSGPSTAGSAEAQRLELRALPAGQLAPVTLTVLAGECVVLAGASGSGKSRLLRAIADLDADLDIDAAAAPGRVTLAGVDYRHYSGAEWRHRVAYVAAESQWWFDEVDRHFSRQPSPEQWQALGLDADLWRQPVSRLSTGERQRLALLRVLVQRPQVLLLDEPTASLDPRATLAVERLIDAYRRQRQAAIIWVSHDIVQARRVGQRYFYIEQGRLVDQGEDRAAWLNLDHEASL